MVTSSNIASNVISSENANPAHCQEWRGRSAPQHALSIFRLFLDAKVEGTAVYNTGGDKLGSVDDLMIDKVSGQGRYAVLEFGGFLGMGTDRYPIPWKLLKYSTDKGGYVVRLDKTRLEKAPKYLESNAPPRRPSAKR
jgi:hypothetical protein